jgi:hypothetical protein
MGAAAAAAAAAVRYLRAAGVLLALDEDGLLLFLLPDVLEVAGSVAPERHGLRAPGVRP